MNEQLDGMAPDDNRDTPEAHPDDQISPGELAATNDLGSDSPEADLQGLVTFIVSNLLDNTDEVKVEAEQRGSSVHLRLNVPQEDLGKVIGRQGRVARAMRTSLTIAGSRHNVRASLDIEG